MRGQSTNFVKLLVAKNPAKNLPKTSLSPLRSPLTLAILFTVRREEKGKRSLTDFLSFKTLRCSCLEAKSFDRNYIVKGTLAVVLNDRPSLEVEKYPVVPLFLQSVQRNCYTRQSAGFYFVLEFLLRNSTLLQIHDLASRRNATLVKRLDRETIFLPRR